MRNKFAVLILFCLCFGGVCEKAFPIGKTGNNNKITDVGERLSLDIPEKFPLITNLADNSVSLRSMTPVISRNHFLPAEFRIFVFRDRYPELASNGSFTAIKNYFLPATETHYDVLIETENRLVLLGQGPSSLVGIVLTHDGRGLVFVGQNYAVIKQGILDTMNGVVFQ